MLVHIIDVHAQKRTVTGTVKSDDGAALPGVSILEKGTTNGALTDAEGNYTIGIQDNATLVFSFIGMKTQEVPTGTSNEISITMEADMATLEEVTVVDYGYFQVKKSDVTGSVSTLSAKDISRVPVTNVEQVLTGRLPGVRVTTSDGSPDSDVSIRIRGGGSITQSNAPLYIVDGLIVSSIRDIPPTDVESITVLKDAASTAIYGARGSNGVIVITTKKPMAGKTTISYNGFFQSKQLPKDRKYNVLSPYEFVLANYEYAKVRSEADTKTFEKFYGKFDDLELYKQKKATDWQDELFGDPKMSQYHNISISGGTEKTRVSLSLTNNTDEGLMLYSGYKRNVANFKLDHEISKALRFEVSARITNAVTDGAGTSTNNAQISIKEAVQTRPVNGLADEIDIDFGNVNSDDDFQSFMLGLVDPRELAKQDWRKRSRTNFVLNTGITWNVIKNLTLKSLFTSSTEHDETLRFYGPRTSESFNNGGNLPLGTKNYDRGNEFRWLNTLAYRLPNFGLHAIDFVGGYEITSAKGTRDFIRVEDFRLSITPQDMFANLALGRTDAQYARESTPVNRTGIFGRANYTFNDRYLLTATFRVDQSSVFSEKYRVGVFPAIAFAWKVKNEPFMSSVSAVDDLKLRASYGTTGNDDLPATASQFLFVVNTIRGPGWNNVENSYFTPDGTTLYNPELKWETTINRNIGLDFSLFKMRVSGSLDAYFNSTRDLLLDSAIPPNTGFQKQWNNIGETSNKGVELALTAFILDKSDLSISANFNIGVNRSKIVELDGTDDRFERSNWASTDLNNINDFYFKEGGSIGDIYGYETGGMYTVDDFEEYNEADNKYTLKSGVPGSGGVVGNTNLRPGFLKIKDQKTVDTDGDGKFDAGDGIIDANDRKVIGNTLPKFQGGFGFDVRYKNFDLSAFFNYQYGNDVYNASKIQYTQFRRVSNGNLLNDMRSDKRFTYIDVTGEYTGTPGEVVTDLEQLGEMNAGKTMWSPLSHGIAGAVVHSWAIEDGSFVRLNNLSVGYSIPTAVISKIHMTRCRFYVTGSNLHVWTKYSGYDPEVSTRGTGLTQGVDFSSFPKNRSYTVGVEVSF
jgi:TonB-linked SusC/RagA family outer membrane protein